MANIARVAVTMTTSTTSMTTNADPQLPKEEKLSEVELTPEQRKRALELHERQPLRRLVPTLAAVRATPILGLTQVRFRLSA